MSRASEILGNSPPHSLDSVQAGLVRLRRNYGVDDEDAQSRGITALHPDRARVRLIDELLDWIRPGVELEAAGWDYAEREEQRAREAQA
jgi:hypothetical protein